MPPVQDIQHSAGPPYPPTTAGIGGQPTQLPDVPVLAVLLLFYIGGAVSNMTIFQLNRRKGHKFLPSGLLFGFCMARILTCCLRIGATTRPDNVSLAIAASILVNAGILIVYIVNLIFAQRMMRARQPGIGWSFAFRWMFKIIFGLLAIALVVVIVFIIISFYTLNEHLKQVSRDLQLAAITYLLIVTIIPLVILAVSFTLPESDRSQTFGQGSMFRKASVLAASATLCVLGAGFKAGANWEPVRPITDPGWYQGKAAFYVFFFVLEIFIIYLLILTRVDKLFHVPNGSSIRRDYRVETEKDRTHAVAPRMGASSEGYGTDRSKEEA